MTTLYRDDMLAHARKPTHRGVLSPCDIKASLTNTTCGDEITVYLTTQEDTVHDAKFEGRGCIISQAAADMFTEYIRNKSVDEVRAIKPETVLGFFGSMPTPSRQPCALLAFEALKRKLQDTA